MSDLGIPAKLIRLCRMALSTSCSSVKMEKNLSEPFDTVRGFRQVDLFNAGVHRNGTLFYKSVQLLTHDIDIGRTIEMSPLRLVLSNGSLRK